MKNRNKNTTKQKRQKVSLELQAYKITLSGYQEVRMVDHTCKRVGSLEKGNQVMVGLPTGETMRGEIKSIRKTRKLSYSKTMYEVQGTGQGFVIKNPSMEEGSGHAILGASRGQVHSSLLKDYTPLSGFLAMFVCLEIPFWISGEAVTAYLSQGARDRLLAYTFEVYDPGIRYMLRAVGSGLVETLDVAGWSKGIIFRCECDIGDIRCSSPFGYMISPGSYSVLCLPFFSGWDKASIANFVRSCCHISKVVDGRLDRFVIASRSREVTYLLKEILMLHFGIWTKFPCGLDEVDPFGESYELYYFLCKSDLDYEKLSCLCKMPDSDNFLAPLTSEGCLNYPVHLQSEIVSSTDWSWMKEGELMQNYYTIVLDQPRQSLCLESGFLVGSHKLWEDYEFLEEFLKKSSSGLDILNPINS